MNWNRALRIASIVALTSAIGGGGGSTGNPAAEGDGGYGPRTLFSQIPAGEVTNVGGGNACSRYELIAYSSDLMGCGGVLSVMPSSKDRVVRFVRAAADGGELDPGAEPVLADSGHPGTVVEVTLETTTLYAFSGADANFYGAAFRMTVSSVETVIYSFDAAKLR